MGTSNIFSLLPAARQRELAQEALTALIRGVLMKHRRSTFGALVQGLAKDKHWGAIKAVRVSSVITPASNTASVRRGRPPRELPEGTTEKLLTAIKKSPGLRSEQLQKQVGFEQPLVRAGLARLRREGKVKTSGQKRSTTYRVS